MAKSKDEDREPAGPHRMVPSPWVDAMRQHWHTVHETEVEGRVGTRGPWYPVPGSRMAVTHVENAEEISEMQLALTHAQTSYDNGWHWRDEQGKRCDVKLVLYQRDGKKGFVKFHEVTQGGRLDVDGADDIPDEHGGFSPVSVWNAAKAERADLVGHVNNLAGKVVELADKVIGLATGVAEILQQGDAVKIAEVQEIGKAHRADRSLDTLERMADKWEPTLRSWASAKQTENLLRTPRPKTGEPVVDAWRMCVDLCDLPTAQLIRERWPDGGIVLTDAWAQGNVTTREAIVALWRQLRPSLADGWEKNIAALPGNLRESLIALVVAITAHEKAQPQQPTEAPASP